MNIKDVERGLKASYLNNKEAAKVLKRSDAVLDKKLSGKRAKVFVDRDGIPTVSVRGSNTLQDWVVTNPQILTGTIKTSKRQKHTNKVIRKTAKKYNQNVNVIGHSLGGILAEQSGAKGNIVTYNKASVGAKNSNDKQVDIRAKGDIVSYFTPSNKNNILIDHKFYNPLKVHGLEALKGLGKL